MKYNTSGAIKAHTVIDSYGKVDRKMRVDLNDLPEVVFGDYSSFTVSYTGRLVEMRLIKGYKRNPGEISVMGSGSKRGKTKLSNPFFEFSQKKYFGKIFLDAKFILERVEVEIININEVRVRFELPAFVDDPATPVKAPKSKNGRKFSTADETKILQEIAVFIRRGEFTGITFQDAKGREFSLSSDALLS